MREEPSDFVYDADDDCYDLVVDKKIQAVVDELCALPHEVLVRYHIQAKCLVQTLGHMLQDIKCNHPNKYPAAMRTVKSWKKYRSVP